MRNSPSRGADANRPHLAVEIGLRIHGVVLGRSRYTLGDRNEETLQFNVTKAQTDGTTCTVVVNGRS